MEQYLIKVSAILFVSHLFYELVIKKNTSFTYKRVYYILSVFIAISAPLITISLNLFSNSALPTIKEFTIQEVNITIADTKTISAFKILSIVYGSVAVFMLIRLIFKLVHLGVLYRKGFKIKEDNYKLIKIRFNRSPFTFFNLIFISEQEDKVTSDNLILQHEIAHSRGMHTLDNLFFELVVIILWFHPSIWYLFREAKRNHEFIADDIVIKKGHTISNYQNMLLAYSLKVTPALIGSSFTQNEIIQRIKMMITDKNQIKHKKPYLLIIFFILLGASTVLYNSCSKIDKDKSVDEVDTKSDKNNRVEKMIVFEEIEPFDRMDMTAFRKYCAENLKYPQQARDNNIEGKVYITFEVSPEGKVQHVKVARGVHKLLDDEAKRVVESSPIWEPIEGESATYTIPLAFSLGRKAPN